MNKPNNDLIVREVTITKVVTATDRNGKPYAIFHGNRTIKTGERAGQTIAQRCVTFAGGYEKLKDKLIPGEKIRVVGRFQASTSTTDGEPGRSSYVAYDLYKPRPRPAVTTA